jgi:hypothetical protein
MAAAKGRREEIVYLSGRRTGLRHGEICLFTAFHKRRSTYECAYPGQRLNRDQRGAAAKSFELWSSTNTGLLYHCPVRRVFRWGSAPVGNFWAFFCSQFCSCRFPPGPTGIHRFQQGSRISLKRKQLKIGSFGRRPETALGAGGRAFKSPRHDHLFTMIYSHTVTSKAGDCVKMSTCFSSLTGVTVPKPILKRR